MNTADKVASLSRLRATVKAKSLHNKGSPGNGTGTFRRDWKYYQSSWDITGLPRDPPWHDKCIPKTPLKPESSYFVRNRADYTINRLTTRCGFVGLMDDTPRFGDVLILPCGGHVPMVLRAAEDSCWTFHGFAWVDGLMAEDFLEDVPELEGRKRKFVLV